MGGAARRVDPRLARCPRTRRSPTEAGLLSVIVGGGGKPTPAPVRVVSPTPPSRAKGCTPSRHPAATPTARFAPAFGDSNRTGRMYNAPACDIPRHAPSSKLRSVPNRHHASRVTIAGQLRLPTERRRLNSPASGTRRPQKADGLARRQVGIRRHDANWPRPCGWLVTEDVRGSGDCSPDPLLKQHDLGVRPQCSSFGFAQNHEGLGGGDEPLATPPCPAIER